MVRQILGLVALLALVTHANGQNVLGIDFGSEYIKLAVVQRSAGVQIVLNEATKRKSPNALAFGEAQREFGDTALVKPHLAITHTRELLGKSAKAELKKIYGPHYFPYEIIADDERGAIKIKEGERFLSPEILVAMVLTYAKSLAQAQTNEKVSDCVITVPAFFRQFERQAMLDAAAIAGLNVLSLINDHTAVALKFGTDNNVAELKEPLNVLFYDMGSTATRVSLVQFSAIPDKESFDKNKTLGQLKVLGVAWDETLGGNAFTTAVQDVLKTKSKKDPTGNARAFAKLGVAAEKAKMILSANKEAHPSIESFIDDYDFRASITRAEFEEQAKHLFERVAKPIDAVIEAANLTIADVHKVEMIGAGWRVPKVQEILLAHTKRSILDKTMNGDEAFCFGAALYAASLSTTFRLRKFGVHDTTPFAVSVDTEAGAADTPDDDEEAAAASEVPASPPAEAGRSRTALFRVGHPVLARRRITFKRSTDLAFALRYDGPLPAGTPAAIALYNVTGMAAAVEKYPNATKPKIILTFRLNRSGLVAVERAEALLEETVEVEVCKDVPVNETNSTEAGEEGKKEEEGKAEDKKEEAKEEPKAEEDKKEGDKKEEAAEDKPEGNQTEAAGKKGKKKVVTERVCTMKPERRVHRVALRVDVESAGVRPLNATQVRAAKVVLEDYDEREAKIRERASAFNALESYIYVTREKLEGSEELAAVTTKEFRDSFTEQIGKLGSWLEDDGWEADTATLRAKLAELTTVGDPAFWRARERFDRPEVVKKARDALALTEAALVNLTKDRPWLNASQIEAVSNKTAEMREWLDKSVESQEKLAGHETPAFTKEDVGRK
mmetsp:Transcript_46472/g.123342  ORF Transcript_46472/g.123342 Transcript_46472/m.123342 type:complete len:840 (+) Transcript_46472:3-2522(+)